MEFPTSQEWASFTFSACVLGNAQRTRRLVGMATRFAQSPGATLHAASKGDRASAEGDARLVRNDSVDADDIAEGGFSATVRLMKDGKTYIAPEDSTTILFGHQSVADQLGFTNTPKDIKRGWQIHTSLLIEELNTEVIGLLHQARWMRHTPSSAKGKRDYAEKEGFKWQAAAIQIRKRLGSRVGQVITVCDREADIHEYLQYKVEHAERFVVRSRFNRKVKTPQGKIIGTLESQPAAALVSIPIPQHGGRPARTAQAEVRFSCMTIAQGYKKSQEQFEMGVVWVKEVGRNTTDALEWLLYTREKLETVEDGLRVVGIYRKRWVIEDFHKAWKSGCNVEERRQQSKLNLEKVAVVLAFVAVRLLQLRSIANNAPDAPCDHIFTELQWKLLHKLRVPNKPLPKMPPTIKWAMQALAGIGGWTDTQRTGRMGWESLWKGWFELDQMMRGVRLASEFKI